MQRWAIPSWNGDVRFEAHDDGCQLLTSDLTVLEEAALRRWGKIAQKRGWISADNTQWAAEDDARRPGSVKSVRVHAPLSQAAAEMAKILTFEAKGVITAFRFTDGQVRVTEVLPPEGRLPAWLRKVFTRTTRPEVVREATKAVQEPEATKAVQEPEATKAVQEPEATKAVTVRRPSLSCPECDGRPERDRMACDVLWDFLDEDQRREWLRRRSITVFGGLTGHAYRLHPRDSAGAAAYGRVAFDLDDRVILHNFLREVPPEEEVLTVKLLLEHRENWLRVRGEVDPEHRAAPGTIYSDPFSGQALPGF